MRNARSARSWPAAACARSSIRSSRRPARARRDRRTRTLLRQLRGVGTARSSRTGSAATGIDAVIAFCREWHDEAARPRVRHRRRRRSSSTTSRCASGSGSDGEVPALGDRLQVPGGAGAHEAAADRGERRPHRRGHAVRRARAGVARRHDRSRWRRCTTTGDRAQRHPRGRHVVIEKGGDIIPKVVGAGARALRPADSPPWEMPTDLSVLRQRARASPRRRSSGAARTRRARRGSGAASSTSRRAAR